MSLKRNPATGNYEAQVDGIYRNSETGDQFQFRKGQVVGEYDAQFLGRVGPWPGETDEGELEVQETAGARKAARPEDKMAAAPENKAR